MLHSISTAKMKRPSAGECPKGSGILNAHCPENSRRGFCRLRPTSKSCGRSRGGDRRRPTAGPCSSSLLRRERRRFGLVGGWLIFRGCGGNFAPHFPVFKISKYRGTLSRRIPWTDRHPVHQWMRRPRWVNLQARPHLYGTIKHDNRDNQNEEARHGCGAMPSLGMHRDQKWARFNPDVPSIQRGSHSRIKRLG